MYNFLLGDMQFPIAPPSMRLSVNGKNETVTLINEGEINILKKPGLSEIEFELLLPNKLYPFAVYPNGFQPATFYLQRLEKLIVEKTPAQLIVNRFLPNGELTFDTDMFVSLESYNIEEDADDLGFDVRVTINLKQYKEYGTKKVVIQTPKTANAPAKASVEKSRSTVGKQTPNTYTFKQGDTLWGIAKKYLGDGSKASTLQTLNKIDNPNTIPVGKVIKLS